MEGRQMTGTLRRVGQYWLDQGIRAIGMGGTAALAVFAHDVVRLTEDTDGVGIDLLADLANAGEVGLLAAITTGLVPAAVTFFKWLTSRKVRTLPTQPRAKLGDS